MVSTINQSHDRPVTNRLSQKNGVFRLDGRIIEPMDDADGNANATSLSDDIMPLRISLLFTQPGGINTQCLSRSG